MWHRSHAVQGDLEFPRSGCHQRRCLLFAMSIIASLLSLGRARGHVAQAFSPSRAQALRVRAAHSEREAVAALCYDLETTGLNTKTNEIIQLAIVCVNSRKNAEFSRLCYPDGEIDSGASAVHGWTKRKLQEHGAVPFGEAWAECEGWLEQTFNGTRPLVWAAHNGRRFDRPILERHIRQLPIGRSEAFSGERATHVDTLVLARAALPKRFGPGSHSLARLHDDAGEGPIADAHDAIADARALGKVWRWLVTRDPSGDASVSQDDPQKSFQRYLQRVGYSSGGEQAGVLAWPGHTPAAQPQKPMRAATDSRASRPSRNYGAIPPNSAELDPDPAPAEASAPSRPRQKSGVASAGAGLSDEAGVIEFPGVGKRLAAVGGSGSEPADSVSR